MARASLFIAAWVAAILVAANLCAADAGDPNHPTGRTGLILIDKIDSHVRFFNPSTWMEVASIEMPARPHDFVLSADHKLAYVAIYGTGVYGHNPKPAHEIDIVNMASHKIVNVIDITP